MMALIILGIMILYSLLVLIVIGTSIFYIWYFDLFSLNLLAIMFITFTISFGVLFVLRKKLIKTAHAPFDDVMLIFSGVLLNPILAIIFLSIFILFFLEKTTTSVGIFNGLSLTTLAWWFYITYYKK